MKKLLISPLLVFTLLFFTHCSSLHIDENDPASMMLGAEEEVKSDHYQVAIERFRSIKNKFPYSKYAIDAQLRIADVYFLQESFTEAALAYEAFRELHPKNPKTPYAVFRIAKSYFKQIPSQIARDIHAAFKAIESYKYFIAQYPGAPEVQEANEDIQKTRNILAEKELYIANFYDDRDLYDSAKNRYENIIKEYPDTPSHQIALEKLKKVSVIIEKNRKK